MQEAPANKEHKEMPKLTVNLDREAMYARAARFSEPDTSLDAALALDEKKADDKPATPPADKSAGTELDTSGEQKPDVKYVPYPALKEERDKRKLLADEVREMKRQQDILMDDNRKMMELLQAGTKPVDDTPDYSDPDDIVKEVIELRKKVDQQSKVIGDVQGKTIARENKTVADTYEAMAKKAAEELEAEGFPGFLDLTEAVGRDLKAAFEESEDQSTFTPDGWKRVYKEKTYPRIIGVRIQSAIDKAKPDKKSEKEALKEQANLSGSPGSPPAPLASEKDEKDMTTKEKYERYMKMRKQSSVFRS